VALSIETTPEPQSPKKRGRDRPKAKPDSDDEDPEEEDNTRLKKRGRKSNGTTRKASPSPTPSLDRASPATELLEPSAIKKWGDLPSWERYIEVIDTVEKTDNDGLFIYFKLYVSFFFLGELCILGISFVGRARRRRAKKALESVQKSSHRG
jgi:chromobox protein 5